MSKDQHALAHGCCLGRSVCNHLPIVMRRCGDAAMPVKEMPVFSVKGTDCASPSYVPGNWAFVAWYVDVLGVSLEVFWNFSWLLSMHTHPFRRDTPRPPLPRCPATVITLEVPTVQYVHGTIASTASTINNYPGDYRTHVHTSFNPCREWSHSKPLNDQERGGRKLSIKLPGAAAYYYRPSSLLVSVLCVCRPLCLFKPFVSRTIAQAEFGPSKATLTSSV